MRPAIVFKDQEIFVEIPPEVFLELLKTYMGVAKNSKTAQKIDSAIAKIVKDLKDKTKVM